ncbi:MAG: aldo/keto reductase [Cyanobacteria bacterium P01_D01_bin.116]
MRKTTIIADIALKYGVKPNQVALAWLLHRAANIILIPGTTTIAHLEENIKTGEIQLTDDEMNALNQI